MSDIGQKERQTQNRLIALFQNELGYSYLGNWEEREDNSNIEVEILTDWLSNKGYSKILIGKVLYAFNKVANDQSKSLYEVNKEVYSMLRYGVPVQSEIGHNKETVWLIDWKNPLANDFAFAEEVTIKGIHNKRPDIVLYVNGIALGVLELKRSTVSKSLIMVWLTKWIREYNPNGRVLVITDRDELDRQIEKVYNGVSENIYRTKSGKDLLHRLNDNSPWLICSLVHKFRGKEEGDVDEYLQELKNNIPTDFKAKGDLYVFVDECHRTQSDKLNKAMKGFLPNAIFIGFTGTPLLKSDKQTSMDVFGKYIHTYKFDEAVSDKVVLDLRYEARDIEQKISSLEKIDEWFDLKTRGLTEYAKTELKQKWGTLKKVFSSKSRLEKIVIDMMLDMEKKERLQNGRGNALLISDSIYNACRYYELFKQAGLNNCAIITSFVPTHADIKGEESGEGYTEKLQRFEIYQKMLADYFNENPTQALKKVETFEHEVKEKFVEEPAQMKLLIVVNKLLTGFDAPPATYLYIDKKMSDHGLFQAVCRVNRLDGDDKDYGYIIDYMDLFDSLKGAFKDYTSNAFDAYEKSDVEGLLKDRLKKGKERLDEAMEAIKALCEAVDPPKDILAHIHYFCGMNTENPDELKETEPKRVALYKLTISLIRAYANIADEMNDAGYTDKETEQIKIDVKHYEILRKEIQLASGDYVDLKQFEPAMRHLIDSYIGAEESRMLANFDNLSLVELLVEKGEEATKVLPKNIQADKKAMAETIEHNLRKVIIEERPTNPIYYEKMSLLLDELIKLRKAATLEYEKYLKKIIELSAKIKQPNVTAEYPTSMNTNAKRALYDNLGKNEELAKELDHKILTTKKDDWRGNKIKTREVQYAIKEVLETHPVDDVKARVYNILNLVKNQKDY